ncbi:MAG TPA: porphobilinogen synthase [Spirochaetota bacterium]|nr:porphobilinogen synthase [Spirochaetota bacterium]HPI89475.1 porphobilinogen synthase [Spirochaetota bacterium]HPR49332.1 porphobilinogen synthase [Spirochaetota bacterium]
MESPWRPRRNRSSRIIRDLTAETVPDRKKLIMPYFVVEGRDKREQIASMPGIDRVCIDNLLKDVESDMKAGIESVLLFGIPAEKDDVGSGAYAEDGIVQRAVSSLKREFPELMVITDVCLCEYTSHGHCGIVSNGTVANDPTLELLEKTALSHARAGCDMVAPSDMMDGRVGRIRQALDADGFENLPILSYAVKYSSAFYGPFRDAAGSAPQFGDRRAYQMDCRNAREALREALLDEEEGADILMVKPALAYLDIIAAVRSATDLPLCAYNVSGEYSMVKIMAAQGFGNERALAVEILTSIFRAGADMIISYHTRDVCREQWF